MRKNTLYKIIAKFSQITKFKYVLHCQGLLHAGVTKYHGLWMAISKSLIDFEWLSVNKTDIKNII